MFRFLKHLFRQRFHHSVRRHHRGWRRVALASAACGMCTAGAMAYAHPPGGPEQHGAMMHEEATAWLDGLLVEIGATDKQKAVAHAARDEVLAAMRTLHESGREDMAEALKLFAGATIDDRAVAALRQRFQARHQGVRQVVVAAVLKIHGTLDAAQRQKLVAALKEFRPEPRGGLHAAIGKRMIEGRIEQMLDRIKADDAQKATVRAGKERVMKAFASQTLARQALFDEALGLLAQEKIDPAALQKLVEKQDAERQAMGDLIVQAARDLHAALKPEQRAVIVKTAEERFAHGPRGRW